MHVLFFARNAALDAFHAVAVAMRSAGDLHRATFFVSGSRHYESFLRRHPSFEDEHAVVREWDLLDAALARRPDLPRLADLERRYGDPTLWNAVVADRRLVWGARYALRLDYAPAFSRDDVLSIVETTLARIERLFDEDRPDAVVSFVCTTAAEYSAWLVARDHGVPFVNLRPSRVGNLLTLGTTPSEPSELVRAAYEALDRRPDEAAIAAARATLARLRSEDGRYEGTLAISREAPAVANARARRRSPLDLVRGAANVVREEAAVRRAPRGDHHVPGPIVAALYSRWLNPRLARKVNGRFGKRYVSPEEAATAPYAFFPLHTEPEVTLLVYSRPYTNQIEVARNVARSLPVGTTLLVKEHPAAMGKRPLAYYEKLLQIPNVRLADPGVPPAQYLDQADVVATIAGSVGFEAIVRRRPVVTLGHTPYEILPPTMVKRVAEPERLADAIRSLLDGHAHDESALERYVAAVMRHSARVNWYTDMLGRGGHSDARGDRDAQAAALGRAVASAVRELAGSHPAWPTPVRGSS